MSGSVHDEHRKRMREEYLKNGFGEGTPSHKLLEFLLFYCIDRKDTNPLAHELIRTFGSLSGVLNASVDELKKVNGIGDNSALLINLILPLARAYDNEKADKKPSFVTHDDIGNFAIAKFKSIRNERAAIISIDSKGKYLGFDFVSEGDVASVGLSVRDVISVLINKNATVAVLVHNHPNGFAVPSQPDIKATENLAKALRGIGIYLADHIVLSGNDFVSMAQSQRYSYIFGES